MGKARVPVRIPPEGWQAAACPLCGSADGPIPVADQDVRGLPIHMVVCRTCGLLYQNPVMTDEALAGYYQEEYVASGLRSRPRPRHMVESLVRGREVARQCGPHLAPGAAVLDVGSQRGGVLRAFVERGHHATGIEPSDAWARFARETLGLNVIHGMMEQADLPPGSFDLVILSHLLEHLRDPVAGLLRVRGLLKPGGLLCLEVPDIAFPVVRVPKSFRIFHVTMFSRATLGAMLDHCGFDVLEQLPAHGHLRLLARRAEGEAPRAFTPPPGEAERVVKLLGRMDPWHCYTSGAYWRRRVWKLARNLNQRRVARRWRELYGLTPEAEDSRLPGKRPT